MNRHIGIAAVSPEGGSLCYRNILRHAGRTLDPRDHPTVSVYNLPVARYVDAVRHDDWHEVGRMLRESAEKLASIGAEVCVSPDNTTQMGVHLAQVGSPIPWLNMTELVADRLCADERRCVGVIGTRRVTSGSVYQTHLGLKGIKAIAPHDDDAEAMDSIIFGELVFGRVSAPSQTRIDRIMDTYAERGCDAVILGCSEAPLLLWGEHPRLPVYDAADILAEQSVLSAARIA